ncbi:ABC transporter substrate-binding protein [Nocardia jejuensis]|uniref:ABC transporter substrate-binding protein n=1 Tax=Nocardia jejuensis TaxID=328049 RepID=UPI000835A2CF|nr:ABC transporter substrate-binding protein [Nocardia jejuensis]
MATRRTVLRAGLLLPLAAACTPEVFGAPADRVRIAVPWGSSELTAFQSVLKTAGIDRSTDVIPLGDDVGTVLGAGRSAPDIVMLPQAGQVRRLAESQRLRPLADTLWSDGKVTNYADGWRPLLHAGARGRLYGVPFKAACKSLLWYDKRRFGELGLPPPEAWTFRDFTTRMDELVRSGSSTRLLALGAADGWMLTDFFENMLLAGWPDTYAGVADPDIWRQNSARGRRDLAEAFTAVAEVWSHPHAFPGGIGKTLTRQFPDAVRDVFQRHSALMVAAPDFAEPIVRSCFPGDERVIAGRVGVALFPGASGRPGPVIGGGDVMVLTRSAKERAVQLVSRLAQPDAPAPWIAGAGGFLAANLGTTPGHSTLLAPVAERCAEWTAFDLADRIGLPGGHNELWQVLTTFLIELDTDGRDAAVRNAVEAVDRLQQRRGE